MVVILLAALVFLIKIAFSPSGDLSLKNAMMKPIPTQTPKVIDLCAPFANDPAKISCQEAKAIALKKYPGEIKYIRSEEASLPMGVYPNITKVKKNVWTVGINLKEPSRLADSEINSAELFVIQESGEAQIHLLNSGKL
jgi:hypothetical protein